MVEKKTLSKVVMLGDMGVGKTTLLNKFLGEKSSGKATVGQDFRKKDLKIGNAMVTLQVWDPAGQEKFQALGFAFYRGSNACLLAFDVSNKASFDKLDEWKKNFLEHASPAEPSKFPFILVGNKTDLARVVSEKDARDWCAKNGGCAYFETCATTGDGVEQAFGKCAELTAKSDESDAFGMPTSLGGATGAMKLDQASS
jgi:Ras-related protein Rab-7A